MEISGKQFAIVLSLLAGATFGIVLNPFLSTNAQRFTTAMNAEFVLLGIWIAIEVWRARSKDLQINQSEPTFSFMDSAGGQRGRTFSSVRALVCFAIILAAWFGIFRDRWNAPIIFNDDTKYLERAQDWPTTRDSLFVPFCEHIVVPTRLLTYFIADHWKSDADRAMAMAWSVVPLFCVSLWLLYLIASREWHSDFIALFAVALFALTRNYHEIITWYSATQWLFSFNMLLVNLLIIQRAPNPVGPGIIAMTSVIAFAGPYAFSLGVMVGPFTTLWILFRKTIPWTWRNVALASCPAVISLISLALLMPRILEWTKTEEYIKQGSRGIQFGWPMLEGIVYGQRLILDRLVFEPFGLSLFPYQSMRYLMQQFEIQESTAIWIYAVLFPIPALACIALLRKRPAAWRIIPFLAILLIPYLLAMPGRSWVHYVDLARYWTRYQLYPQLGFALLLAETVSLLTHRSATGQPTRLSAKQMGCLCIVVGISFAIDFAGPPYSK